MCKYKKNNLNSNISTTDAKKLENLRKLVEQNMNGYNEMLQSLFKFLKPTSNTFSAGDAGIIFPWCFTSGTS